jgi:hypothetical protein
MTDICNLVTQTTVAPVVFEGHTYSSGHVYISFPTVFASNVCNSVTIGTPRMGSILTLQSSELSSLRYPFYASDAFSFNYADLNSPVPWSAYGAQADCFLGFCETISSEYNPQLMIPPAITDMEPGWSDCEVYWGGIHDPPHALSTAVMIADPPPTSKPAEPCSTPKPPVAPPTPVPASQDAGKKDPPASANPPPNSPQSDPPPQPPKSDPPAQPSPNIASNVVGVLFGGTAKPTSPDSGSGEAVSSPIIGSEARNTAGAIVGGQTVQVIGSGAAVVGDQTISVGGSPVTINNTPVSLAAGGIVVGTGGNAETIAVNSPPSPTPGPAASVVVTVGGQTLAVDPTGGISFSGTTISPGGPAVTIGSQIVSIGVSGVVVNPAIGQTGPAVTYGFTPAVSGSLVTVGSQVFTVASSSGVLYLGTTSLNPAGPPVTISGHVFSAGTAGLFVDGTSMIAGSNVASTQTTRPAAVGDIIASGMGMGGSTTATSSTASSSTVSTTSSASSMTSPSTSASSSILSTGLNVAQPSTTSKNSGTQCEMSVLSVYLVPFLLWMVIIG